jgi:hypothetical protein
MYESDMLSQLINYNFITGVPAGISTSFGEFVPGFSHQSGS